MNAGWWVDSSERLQSFYQALGPVAPALVGLMALLWFILCQRVCYVLWGYPALQEALLRRWWQRSERLSWFAQAQRSAWLFEAETALFRGLSLVRVLLSLCPMLGLLGTLLGMIQVFEVLSLQRVADAEQLADGIAQATLPTLVGMSAAVTGLFGYTLVQRWVQRLLNRLAMTMRRRQ